MVCGRDGLWQCRKGRMYGNYLRVIFYCSSAFDAELTEAHKMDVLEKRMSDAVTDTYADYMSQLSSKENQDVWSEVTVDTSLKLESASFMEVYQQYFPAKE